VFVEFSVVEVGCCMVMGPAVAVEVGAKILIVPEMFDVWMLEHEEKCFLSVSNFICKNFEAIYDDPCCSADVVRWCFVCQNEVDEFLGRGEDLLMRGEDIRYAEHF